MNRKIVTTRKKSAVGARWSNADRVRAVTAFLSLGNAKRVEEMTGIPMGTVNFWKTQPWWYEVADKVRKSQNSDIQDEFTRIVQKAQAAIIDRLENGDWSLDKNGTLFRKPVAAKDAAVIAGIAVEKRSTVIQENKQQGDGQTSADRLKELEEQFRRFITAKTIKGEATIVQEKDEVCLSETISEKPPSKEEIEKTLEPSETALAA